MTFPFENDTSTIVKKLACAGIRSNRQRNLLAGTVIFFTSLILTFSTILICNATLEVQMINRVNNFPDAAIVIFAVAVILLFTSGLAIKNIMYISVLQRTREFAQLRTLGATYRQIIAVVNSERKRLTWKPIFGGVLLGFFCNIMLPLHFYLWPCIFCAVFSGAFVWFVVFCSFRTPAKQAASVSPVAALRPEQKHQLQKRKGDNDRITPHSMGKKYFRSDSKKARYTLASLVLSGVLMFLAFSVFYAVDIEKLARQPYYADSDLYLILRSTADDNSTYDLMKNSPFTESLWERIAGTPGVTGIYSSKMLDCEVFDPDVSDSVGIEKSLNGIVDEAGFVKLIVDGELPYDQCTLDTVPVVVNRSSYYYENAGFDWELGDTFYATVDTGYSDRPVQLSVCGFIEDKDDGAVLYTSPYYLDSLAEMNCDVAWYICTEKGQTEAVVEEVRSLVSADDRVYTAVLADDLSEYQAYFHNARVVITTLLFLVCLFSFINLLNTCITNTIIRQYDYALLEAAGMTKTEIKKMQDTETRIYFAGGFIGSCVTGAPLGYYLCSAIAQIHGLFYISYQFPLGFLMLYILYVFAIYAIATFYQKHLLWKQSVIERIRTV